MRSGTLVGLVVLAGLMVGCGNKDTETSQDGSKPATVVNNESVDLSPISGAEMADWTDGSSAGVSWKIPSAWSIGAEAPMRVATYVAAALEGDPEPAECRVSFFGTGQGGDVLANIKRWAGQMESETEPGKAPEPKTTINQVNGLVVTLTEIDGAYVGRMLPGAQEMTAKANFKMLAAIVEAPQGSLFFKMIGPEATSLANRDLFLTMVGSLSKTEG